METIPFVPMAVLKELCYFILFLLFLPWKLIVVLGVKVFKPDFGQLVNYTGAIVTLSDVSDPDQGGKLSICCYLRLSGKELSLKDLLLLFEENVLEGRLPCGKLRYPELRQRIVNLGGYQFWRDDACFRGENHVTERAYHGGIIPSQQELFEEMLNLPFRQGRSPWESLLLKSEGRGGEGKGSCVVLLRMAHVMADARSLVKLVVEALGGQELTTAKSTFQTLSRTRDALDRFLLYSLLPLRTIRLFVRAAVAKRQSQHHPWRIADISGGRYSFIVGSTGKLSLGEVKQIGRRTGTDNTSAVIMAILAGAIRRFDKRAADFEGGFPAGWVFPKPNHPPTLTNHLLAGVPFLPTDVEERAQRLRQCGQVYRQSRFSHMGRVIDLGNFLISAVVTPVLAPFSREGNVVPLGVTNIAGHLESLWIGGRECTDFNFCVNLPRSSMGLMFVVFSYKDSVQINVVAKSSILSATALSRLVKSVELETAELTNEVGNEPVLTDLTCEKIV